MLVRNQAQWFLFVYQLNDSISQRFESRKEQERVVVVGGSGGGGG